MSAALRDISHATKKAKQNWRSSPLGGCLTCLLFLLMAAGPALTYGSEIIIETNLGAIGVELYDAQAPKTVANFLSYVSEDAYEGAIFHRVIDGFMIQTGGYLKDLSPLAEQAGLVNEADAGLKNVRGTLAMARMDEIDSATRQFFINVADNPHLDHQEGSCSRADEAERLEAAERGLVKPRTCLSFGYAVFGRVIHGMEVVDEIAKTETDIEEDFLDMPSQRIWIKQIRRP
jgi:peptidyl-prolyl cis-trans isomerase B (cyclophilin B)